MKRPPMSTRLKIKAAAIFVFVLTALIWSSTVAAQQSSEPLTNASVIKLVKAGFKEKTIVAIIQSRPNNFKMDTEQLIELKRNGVGENVILAMLSSDGSFSGDDDFTGDSFFKKKIGDSDQSDGTDIFGSSSGSKSQTKQRGANGSSQNDGSVTGSATVRIIRPPTEAGGDSSAKLERSPTLNNEAVIRLVDAGFSEGTIIKRIENSPAEFDLSPAKIEELHKRRVTDAIIAAMTAAMGDEKQNTPTTEREK